MLKHLLLLFTICITIFFSGCASKFENAKDSMYRNDEKGLLEYLDRNMDINHTDINGDTLLTAAVGRWNKYTLDYSYYRFDGKLRAPFVKLILDRGAKVNVLDKHGNTPLLIASGMRNGHSVVQLLLDRYR